MPPFRDRALRAAEHHAFTCGGRALLFDVNALTVADSCALDRLLLSAAAHPLPPARLVAHAVARGWDAVGARLRLRVLRILGFLLLDDELPPPRHDGPATCAGCWSRNLCPGELGGDCDALRRESEAAIAAFAQFRTAAH